MILLVSILIPTIAGREAMLTRALTAARLQTYPHVEVIVDESPGILGAKRNRMVRKARGDVLVHFDDDDAQSPTRVVRQVDALASNPDALVCGTSRVYEWDERARYAVEVDLATVLAASLAYRREAWEARQFDDDKWCSECTAFKAHHAARTVDMRDRSLMVYVRHDGNVTGSLPPWGQNRASATAAALSIRESSTN